MQRMYLESKQKFQINYLYNIIIKKDYYMKFINNQSTLEKTKEMLNMKPYESNKLDQLFSEELKKRSTDGSELADTYIYEGVSKGIPWSKMIREYAKLPIEEKLKALKRLFPLDGENEQ